VTHAARARAFGAAAIVTELAGWAVLVSGSGAPRIALGLLLVLAGVLLWAGVPAVSDTRAGPGVLSLGLKDIRRRVQGWDTRDNSKPDNNQMQRTGPGESEPRR
jgi:hypothetical protein